MGLGCLAKRCLHEDAGVKHRGLRTVLRFADCGKNDGHFDTTEIVIAAGDTPSNRLWTREVARAGQKILLPGHGPTGIRGALKRPPPLIRSPAQIFAMTLEYSRQPAHLEQVSDPRLRICHFQVAMRLARGKMNADERTKAGTVDVADVRQVEHDALGSWDEVANGGLQEIGR